MGIFSTPLDNLSEDEQIVAEFLIYRLRQVDLVVDELESQVEQVVEGSEQLEEWRDKAEQANRPWTDFEQQAAVENAEQIRQQGKVNELVGEQVETLYDAYLQSASKLDEGEVDIHALAEPLLEIDEAVFWLDEQDKYHRRLDELVS